MRRLKADWATHGRQYNIYPIREYKDGKPTGKIEGWRNTLCPCFDLKNKQAYRFKDTPTTNFAKRKELAWERKPRARDRRRIPVEREIHGKARKGGSGDLKQRSVKVQCGVCGYLLEVVRLPGGAKAVRDYKGQFWTRFPLCEGCKKKRRER
jgi:hypothetical protein